MIWRKYNDRVNFIYNDDGLLNTYTDTLDDMEKI